MRARFSLLGTDLLGEYEGDDNGQRHALGQSRELRLPVDEAFLAEWRDWAATYERAVKREDTAELLALGQRMFARLDQGGWMTRWMTAPGDRSLEIAVREADSPAAAALLDLPWELLAARGDYLAFDASQTFIVFRSLGRNADAVPKRPAFRDIAILFMAAAPEGVAELDFEAEEVAILEATARLPVHLLVEESGCATFLRDRVAQEGPFDVVHLSCHGDLIEEGTAAAKAAATAGPVLALETPEGRHFYASPGDVVRALGENKAPLVFLSACRSAETSVGAAFTEPFVRHLVRAGVANVLGWDGSVYDGDAIGFAKTFYQELAEQTTIPYAAAIARRQVLTEHRKDPKEGSHWHLARVYAGPAGAGVCCERGRPARTLRTGTGFREFLDKAQSRVPVATARTFAGRRRQGQQILRCFREGAHAGVLLYGMGNLGKSSLAARIANRLPTYRTAVIYERYDGREILERVLAQVPAPLRGKYAQAWSAAVRENGAALREALETLLREVFNDTPLLLIIDDLEQILTTPAPGAGVPCVRDANGDPDVWRISLRAVLQAFRDTDTWSKVLFTSRYDFTLCDESGRELTDRLSRVQLLPMTQRQRTKQWEAARQALSGSASTIDNDDFDELVARALKVAGGNPGLQEILCRPLLSGEPAVATRAIDAIERFVESGDVPEGDNAAQEFFQRVSFKEYHDALTAEEQHVLQTAAFFTDGVQIPTVSLVATARLTLSLADATASLSRLMALGLVEDWETVEHKPHAAINRLARGLASVAPTGDEARQWAAAALPGIQEAWQDKEGDFPIDRRGVEAARLSLLAEASGPVIEQATLAAAQVLFLQQHDAVTAWTILKPALAALQAQMFAPSPPLILLASQCADRLGETAVSVKLLEQGMAAPEASPVELAAIKATHAEAMLLQRGPSWVLERLHEAASLFDAAGDARSKAVTMGKIADVLQRRGETDEALRIRRDEQLPVYEQLGDVHSRAVVMGKIADVLQLRGDTDEALRIRREEELPVYERLGDVRARAVTMGEIADVLEQRGEMDETLRIRREEELPVYERLGDVRSRAVTMGKIADVLQRQGRTDEALRIRRDEELLVYDRLGDVRSRAVTMGKIADGLRDRGETDEALQIMRRELLPVFERLGEVREYAVTMGKIAGMLELRGETDEAVRIRREEELAVYERLSYVRELLVARTNLAIMLAKRGRKEDAPEVVTLLVGAWKEARRLRSPEAAQIEEIFKAMFNRSIGDVRKQIEPD